MDESKSYKIKKSESKILYDVLRMRMISTVYC